MFKTTTVKPLSGYTSLKRKWQDSIGDEDLKGEESEVSDVEDLEDDDDISEDSEELSVALLLRALKESSRMPSFREQFQTLLQESLLNSLQVLKKELTTIRELVDECSSQMSKLECKPTRSGTMTPKTLTL